MAVEWTPREVPGLFQSSASFSEDDRGSFTKVLSGDLADQPPLRPDEVFWSRSHRGVLRGLHVQVPPHPGRKMIALTSGEVRDFVLDLRVGSPWFGRVWETTLTLSTGALLIPAGCAHGFEALTDDVTMVYLQEGTYDPACDTGVLWSSVGMQTSSNTPVVSRRDQSLPALTDFESPFKWSDS